MRNFKAPEERFPLLMLFFDDNNKSHKKSRTIFIDKSRYRNIASGASSVITDWPTHLTGCWFTTLLAMVSMMLLVIILFAAAIRPLGHSFLPRCNTGYGVITNKTQIYLAHNSDPFNQNELDSIEKMINFYPNCDIQIIIYQNGHVENLETITNKNENRKNDTTTKTTTGRALRKNDSTVHLLDFLIEEGRRKRNKRKIIVEKLITKPKLRNLNDLLTRYQNVKCLHLSLDYIFENSPLYMVYDLFSPELTTFAIRTLQLWDCGGISFALPKKRDYNHLEANNDDKNNEILKYIESGYSSYKKLGDGLVTIDDNGFHMVTKTTCHSFFGEMLQFLKQATKETTSKDIVKKTLKSFCNRGAVDLDYCKNLM